MGELVGHHERVPIIVIAQTRRICGWMREDDDSIRRKRRGVSIHIIDVVGYDQIDGATWRYQLCRELGVGALGVDRRAARLLFYRRSEVHAKMLCANRAPLLIWRKLPTRCPSRAEK